MSAATCTTDSSRQPANGSALSRCSSGGTSAIRAWRPRGRRTSAAPARCRRRPTRVQPVPVRLNSSRAPPARSTTTAAPSRNRKAVPTRRNQHLKLVLLPCDFLAWGIHRATCWLEVAAERRSASPPAAYSRTVTRLGRPTRRTPGEAPDRTVARVLRPNASMPAETCSTSIFTIGIGQRSATNPAPGRHRPPATFRSGNR